MRATAWNNSFHAASGAGYGFRIEAADRDAFFDPAWTIVYLDLPGHEGPSVLNVGKKSFWAKKCGELISIDIGLWLKKNGYIPWPKGKPPHFELTLKAANHFKIEHQDVEKQRISLRRK